MRGLLVLCLILASVPVSAEGPGSYGFTGSIPEGLPEFSSWEKIAHELVSDDDSVSVRYELFVSPELGALYQIVRLRVLMRDKPGNWRPADGVEEHLCWNKPKAPGRYFVRIRKRTFKKLWFGKTYAWVELEPGSGDYVNETIILRRILTLQNRLFDAEDYGGSQLPR